LLTLDSMFPALLPIRTRSTIDDDGMRTYDDTVYCAVRKASISVDDCLTCGHCNAAAFSRTTESWLACDRPGNLGVTVRPGTVASVLTPVVDCVRAITPIAAAAAIFVERQLVAAPVVDKLGRLLGMVSAAAVLDCADSPDTISTIMTRGVGTVTESAPIEHAARVMTRDGVHSVPVIAPDGTVVGVVTSGGLAQIMTRRRGLRR
jgi:CBS domain-containing protein